MIHESPEQSWFGFQIGFEQIMHIGSVNQNGQIEETGYMTHQRQMQTQRSTIGIIVKFVVLNKTTERAK